MLRERAIEIAHQLAQQEAWPWLEPIKVEELSDSGKTMIKVRSNAEALGCNVEVLIDSESGEVIKKKYLPR